MVRPLLLGALASLGILLGTTAVEAKEKLVAANPSQMQRTDQRGFNWDPNVQGVIRDGTSDCFDGAMTLYVNGGAFNPTKPPMQTKDGQEYVLRGAIGQIAVTRRLRIESAAGAVRYVEIFENKSKRSVRVSVEVRSMLGSNASASVSNLGRALMTGPLQKGETSVFAIQHSGSRPSVIFQLRGARSKSTPVLNIGNNRNFHFTWSLSIPAGKTTAILHSVAQRRFGTPPQPKQMEAEIKPMLDGKWARSLPGAVRAVLANHSGAGGSAESLTQAAPAHQEVIGLAKAYEVERGAEAVVFIEREKPLSGSASGGAVSVKTRMGEVGVPFEDVAVLRGGANSGRSMRLFLRDGEILAGEISAPGLVFKTSSGLDIQLDPAGIDALFLPKADKDGEVAKETDAFLTQLDGTKLSLEKAEGVTVEAVSPWGDLSVPLGDVVRIRYARDPLPGLWILLRDGSRFPLAVRGSAWTLASRRFGSVEVDPGSIAAWSRHGVAAALTKGEDDEVSPSTTHAQLVGGCYLVGSFDETKLTIETVAGSTPVEVAQIRRIERSDEGEGGAPNFAIHTMSGEAIQGRLTKPLLAFRTPRGVCRVPVLHLWAYRWSPPPKAPDPEPDDETTDEEGKDGDAKDEGGNDEDGKDEDGKDEDGDAKDGDAKDKAPSKDAPKKDAPPAKDASKKDAPKKDAPKKKTGPAPRKGGGK